MIIRWLSLYQLWAVPRGELGVWSDGGGRFITAVGGAER